jgi:hypothetical protein
LGRSNFGGEPGSTGQPEVLGGVSWLISWPRKKLITSSIAEDTFALAA